MIPGLTWFETHAHLSDAQFDPDRGETVDRAVKAGVATLVEIADGPEEWAKAQSLAEKHPDHVYWAAGLHPYYADQSSPKLWEELARLSRHSRFVAVGEVGLDYAKGTIPKDIQINAFKLGLETSRKVNKPLIIHCREAFSDLLPTLKSFHKNDIAGSASPGVIHCFSGGVSEARELMDLGYYLGVDAPITYPKSQPLRDALKEIPLDRLVLETDSPYLPPQTHRGKRNEPFHIPIVGQALADIKRISATAAAEQTVKNSFNLFRLKPTH